MNRQRDRWIWVAACCIDSAVFLNYRATVDLADFLQQSRISARQWYRRIWNSAVQRQCSSLLPSCDLGDRESMHTCLLLPFFSAEIALLFDSSAVHGFDLEDWEVTHASTLLLIFSIFVSSLDRKPHIFLRLLGTLEATMIVLSFWLTLFNGAQKEPSPYIQGRKERHQNSRRQSQQVLSSRQQHAKIRKQQQCFQLDICTRQQWAHEVVSCSILLLGQGRDVDDSSMTITPDSDKSKG